MKLSSFLISILIAVATAIVCAADGHGQCGEKLYASDAFTRDHYGNSVATDGALLVVGSPDDNPRGIDSGSAYVYRHDGSSWQYEAKLFASDGAEYDRFGLTVDVHEDAVNGDLVVVGAPYDDDKGSLSGSAYAFRYSSGSWDQEWKYLASDGAATDNFGFSVATNGRFVAVGAPRESSDRGAVYMFYDAGAWQQDAKIVAPDGVPGDSFGRDVALEWVRLLVGAPTKTGSFTQDGAAYAYVYGGLGIWIHEGKLLAYSPSAFEHFGFSVAYHGSRGVVGTNHTAGGTQYAYVFDRGSLPWTLIGILVPQDASVGQGYGWDVGVDGAQVLVGAPSDDELANGAGAAYLYDYDGTRWTQRAKIQAPDAETGDLLGWSVDLGSEFLVAGAAYDSDVGLEAGSVYTWPATGTAGWMNYGDGWPGTLGVPGLLASDVPALGMTIELIVGNSAGHDTIALLFLGFSAASIPTSLDGTLLVSASSVLSLFLPRGGVRVPSEVPCDPRLDGFAAYAQALVADPGASHGAAFTRGLQLTLGQY